MKTDLVKLVEAACAPTIDDSMVPTDPLPSPVELALLTMSKPTKGLLLEIICDRICAPWSLSQLVPPHLRPHCKFTGTTGTTDGGVVSASQTAGAASGVDVNEVMACEQSVPAVGDSVVAGPCCSLAISALATYVFYHGP